jgi:molybdopterin synthase catalytic subunit
MPESTQVLVRVGVEPIDVAALEAWAADPGAGAVLTFVGRVRDTKQGKRVLGIDYEAYQPMAERVLLRIGTEVLARWPASRAALVHRTGYLAVGEASLAIAISAPHRDAGFAALRFAVEEIKRDAPVWKREHGADGAVWVQEGA